MPNNVATAEDILGLIGKPSAEDLEEQAALLKVYRSRARLSPAERTFARGVELEAHHLVTGDRDGLAEALAMQGKFAEAAKVAIREDLKELFAEKAVAVDDADEDCACDDFTEAGGYAVPTQYVESYVHSRKHGKEMPFIRCTQCGELNARRLPLHLAEQRAMRHSDAKDADRLAHFKLRK